MLTSIIDPLWFLFFARFIVGVIMVYFGWPKVKDLAANSKDFSAMGFKPGWFWGTPFALIECFGGIAMILGFFPEVVAALYAFMMVVGTFWKYKRKKSFGDLSYDILILALCLIILSFGAGTPLIYSFPLPPLQWYMLLIALLAAALFAFLPQILGKKYQQWDSD